MKKLLLILLSICLLSQSAFALAPYRAYPLGDGRVEVTGEKNLDEETSFIILNQSGDTLVDVGQIGSGEGEFSKILYISSPDNLIYTIGIGSENITVKNVSPASALADLNAVSADGFEALLNTYNKIFNADTSLMEPVKDKAAVYEIMADYTFTSPENVANEYADIIAGFAAAQRQKAFTLIAEGKASEAFSKYLVYFDVDHDTYSTLNNKDFIAELMNNKSYTDDSLLADFADFLTIACINEANGDDFINLVRENQAKIGLDLSEEANIAAAVYTKTDAYTFKSFAEIKQAFINEISLNKLNTATTDTVKTVIEQEDSVLGLLATPGYSTLSEAVKLSICQAMVRGNFNTVKEAQDEFALVVQRALTPTPSAPSGGGSTGGSSGGGNYSVSGGNPLAPSTDEEKTSLPFTDVKESHWGYSAIESLYSQNIVSGTSDTTFEPERQVTREEFIKMLVGTFNMYSADAPNVFSDIAEDDWCIAYVASAHKAGLTNGMGDGSFGKGKTLTRQDMAVMAARCASIADLSLKNVNSNSFSDENQFADYAKDSIYALSAAGIINGVGNGMFDPSNSCTRAMAAKVCNELLKLYKGGAAQ